MRNTIKKMFLLLVAYIMVTISSITVSAAVYRKTTANINLRTKAGSLSSDTIIDTIPKGTTLQLIGKSTKYSNWYYVEYDGKSGFIEGTYLTSTSSSSSSSEEEESGDSIKTISVNLNLRSSAKITSSNVITVLSKGTKVSLIRKSGNWYYVETPSGQKGYIADGYFTSSSSSSSSGTYKITTVAVNMRSSAKVANGNIILTVPAGKKVKVLGSTGNWYQVSYNGRTGYMKSGYFKDESTTSSYVTEKTSVNLRLRSSKSTSSSSNVITTIPKGTTIKVYQESNGWYYVAYGSRKGYVKAGYFVSDSSSSSSGETGKTTANVRLRSSRSTNSSDNIITVIPSGRTVTILGDYSGWYKVRYNGQTGYVSSDYVS